MFFQATVPPRLYSPLALCNSYINIVVVVYSIQYYIMVFINCVHFNTYNIYINNYQCINLMMY